VWMSSHESERWLFLLFHRTLIMPLVLSLVLFLCQTVSAVSHDLTDHVLGGYMTVGIELATWTDCPHIDISFGVLHHSTVPSPNHTATRLQDANIGLM
jgi:hypothetical protein